MPDPFEGIVESPEVLSQGGIGVKIKGSPHFFRDPGNRQIFTAQFIIAVLKVMHKLSSEAKFTRAPTQAVRSRHYSTVILTKSEEGPCTPPGPTRAALKK